MNPINSSTDPIMNIDTRDHNTSISTIDKEVTNFSKQKAYCTIILHCDIEDGQTKIPEEEISQICENVVKRPRLVLDYYPSVTLNWS